MGGRRGRHGAWRVLAIAMTVGLAATPVWAGAAIPLSPILGAEPSSDRPGTPVALDPRADPFYREIDWSTLAVAGPDPITPGSDGASAGWAAPAPVDGLVATSGANAIDADIVGLTATGDGLAVEPDSSTFTPAGIPCYTTGPFVEVFYGYAASRSNRYTAKLPAIREAIARADDIYNRSAAKYGGVRHVRWLMTPTCKLSVTAVSFPADAFFHAEPAWFFSNLVSRGLINRSEKGVILMDIDEGGGLTQRNGRDERPGQDNTDNFGGTMSLVFGGSWDLSGYFYGGWVTAHELTHAMGAVNRSAPHYNTTIAPGHCSDGDDVMCRDNPGRVCPRSLTGLLDCNGDDYFNPNPPAGSYLRTHWNTANNRFLARTDPAKWDRLDRPIVKITSPGAGQISGTADIRISVTPPAGHTIGNVALYGNGFDLPADQVGTSLTHFKLKTIPTEDTGGLPSAGLRNEQVLDLRATAWDDIDRAQDSAAVRVTVSNPQIRLVRPTPDQPVSGSIPWEVVALPEKGGSITRVQILNEGSVLATDTSAPYAGTIDMSGNDGPVELQARVTTASGLTRLTRPRVIDVKADPIVRLLAPLDTTDTVLPKAVARLVAEVDERSAIATKVEFVVDGAVVGTDTTAPYAVDWDDRSATAGEHLVRARATLANGALHVSEPATIDLWAPGGGASVTSPAEGVAISQPTPIVVTVTPPAGATIDSVSTQFGDLTQGPVGTWTGELDPFGAPLGRVAIVPSVSWSKGAASGTFAGRARIVRLRGPAGVTASITSPSAGTTSASSVAVSASVNGASSAGGVERVYFTAGGVDIGNDATAPFGVTWTPPADGTYRIWARVLLGNGELADASPVDVAVRQTTVALTKPGPGTDVSGPVHLTAAFANDRTTYLEWLRFYLDGRLIATDPLAPIDVVWDPRSTALGSHTLVAKAFLGDGRVLSSAPRTITVTPPKVVRLAGIDRYSTAAAISRATFDPGVPVAYVATGLDFPDALAGAALAGKRGGPILLTPPGGLPPSTIAELQRLKPATIVVLGGPSVLSGAILSALRAYTSGSVTRIAGSDRYSTAAAVSRSGYDPGVAVAYVAIGTNFPDALAGAALAGATGGPVLLVSPTGIPCAPIATELRRLKPGRIVIFGGTGVIPGSTATALKAYTTGSVSRLAGADRYATAAAVAAKFASGLDAAYVATGLGFADALAGAAAAGHRGLPIVLVAPTQVPAPSAAALARLDPGQIVILGGAGVVAASLETRLATYVR